MLAELATALKERAIDFTYTDEAARLIAREAFSVKYGARNMRRYIQTHVEDALASLVIASRGNKLCAASLCVRDGALSVDAVNAFDGGIQ